MKLISLYDRQCALCRESKKLFQALDWLKKVNWLSLQEYEKENDHLHFTPQELRRELHLILPSGVVLKGFFAVRRLMLSLPLTVIPALFLYLPFVYLLGVPVYKWIAKNRHYLLRKKCDDGNCSL